MENLHSCLSAGFGGTFTPVAEVIVLLKTKTKTKNKTNKQTNKKHRPGMWKSFQPECMHAYE